MGDDPYLPDLTSQAVSRGNGSSATGGIVNNIHAGLSKNGQLFVVVASCLALGLSVGAVVIAALGGREAARAEREARMLQYYLLELDARVIGAGIKPDSEAISKKLEEAESN